MKTLHTIYTSFAKRLVMSLIVLMIVGVGTVLGAEELAYTIVFSNGANGNSEIKTTTQASTVIASDSRKYVTTSPFSAISKAYYGDTKTSIRLGASSAAGALTIALSSDGQVSATKIVVSCGYWKSGENPTLSINSLASQSISSSEQDLTFNVNKDITSLSLNTSKRAYIYSISVYTEASAPTYAVTWKNGGHGTAPTSPTSASEVTLPKLSATGYTHTGWKANVDVKNGSTTIIAGYLINNGTTVILSQATTFTAQWQATTYTITLNNQSANTAGTTSITATYNSNANLISNITIPQKNYHNFGGYYTQTNGNGTQLIDSEGNIIANAGSYTDANKLWKYDGNITLYAKWTEKALTNYRTTCTTETSVTLNPNGGTFASTPDGWTKEGNNYTKEVEGSITLPTPIHDGCYDFEGWYDAQTGGNKIDADAYTPTGDIELFAHWRESTTSFIAMIDDENIPTVEGFAIEIGLNEDGTGKGTDGVETTCGNNVYLFQTLVQGYKEVQWTVTIDGTQETIAVQNDGDVPYFVMPKANVFVSAELIECDEMDAPDVTATSTNNSITLSWDPIIGAKEYNVFIFYDYGNSHQQDDAALVENETNYTFTNLDAEHTYTYIVQAQIEIGTCFTETKGEITTASATCTVTYNANGGIGTPPSDETEYTNGATVTVLGNYGKLTQVGYAFTGWNTKDDGTGTSYEAGETFKISANTTLYAQWCEAYWKLVTNASELENDTRIVIAAKDYNFALSTTQNNANRGQAEITKKYNTITIGDDVQTLSVVGPVNNNFALYSPGPLSIGYLYAASNSANQLKTKTIPDNNDCYWSIAISPGAALILAQGDNSHDQIKYNHQQSGQLFSCYESTNTTMSDVVIYKEVCVQDQYNVNEPKLTNATAANDNPKTVAADAKSLTLKYSANTRYLLPETITVKMGGVELVSGTDYTWNKETGVLTITVTGFYGDIDVKIVAEEDPCYGFAMSEVTATSTTNSITLSWTAVGGATGYNVRLGDGAFAAATDLTHTFEGLTPKTTYNWEVQAVKEGLCEASKTGSTTTQNETFTVSWIVNGNTESPYATESVMDGNSITLSPSNPEDNALGYCASKFVGWSETDLGSAAGQSAPDDLCAAAEIKAKYTSLTEDKTFYAVFATPEGGTTGVSLSFANTAQRTSYSTEQQIWEQNGITLTNDKGSSTSNVGDYANPARFYKNSSITIEYAYPMYKIVFDCNGDNNEHITNLAPSIDDDNVQVNQEGEIVTVEFNEPVESYTITLTEGQVRLDNLTIIPIAYSNYVTQCDDLPTPTYAGPSIDKNELKVKCGDRSSMNSAAVITFDPTTNYDLSLPITLTASEGFLVSTNKTKNDAYKSSVTVNPVKSGDNKGKITQNVYVRAEASADTKADYTGTITIEGAQVETKTIDVTAIVTCEPHTMTFYSYNTKTKAKYYVGDAVEEPETPGQPCEGYVFDGWAESIVEEGATAYSKVTFPYEMPNRNTILYAVYQIQAGSNYTKVTEDLKDYSGEYLIVYESENVAFNGGLKEDLDVAENNIEIIISGNTIKSSAITDAAKFTIAKVDGGYSIQSASGYYIGAKTGNNNGLATSTTTAYPTTISIADLVQDTKHLRYNSDSNQKRFRYYKSDSYAGQKAIALYKKDISYTSYPDCTPLVEPETPRPRALPSAFSVSETEKVQFSAGNLQYHTSDEVWRFAPEQYDVLGEQNIELGNPNFKDWVDMFGWSSDGKYGVNASYADADYNTEAFVDWGTLFGDEGWYTMSTTEWNYLLYSRPNASQLKQVAKVGETFGILLFPDDWVKPAGIVEEKITTIYNEQYYAYPLEDWKQLEAAGAVFMPAAGRRLGGAGNTTDLGLTEHDNKYSLQYVTNYYGYYWTSSQQANGKADFLINCIPLGDDEYIMGPFVIWSEMPRYGQSVRLVRKCADLQVVEWKQNSVSVMYTGAGTHYITQVGNNIASGELSESTRIDHAVYRLSTTDLTTATNQPLTITIKDGETTIGAITITIPAIVVGEKNSTSLVTNNDIAKATSVVILDGATLTADATKYTYDDIVVYPGGKLVINNGGQLGMYTLTLRAGSSWGATEYEHKYPEFVLNTTDNGAYSNTSAKINYDYVTTKEQYYTFVAPFAVNTKDIKYPVDIYGSNVAPDNTGSFEFQYYDGAARAEGKTGWTVVSEGDDGANLEAGQGYTFLGMPKKINGTRQKYGIHRIPMSVSAADAMSHEKTDQTISVAPHPSEKNKNSGWNLIGNPYMSTIGGLTNEDIQVGKLVHTNDANGNWTGGWHWDTSTETTNQRFLVIPSNDGQSFSSTQASNATLHAFKNFFVQISDEDANALVIPYNKPTNVLAAPARRTEEVDQDIELAIVLEQDEAHSDQLDFLINNIYTEDFERDADFTKMMNATNLNLYGVHPYDNLSFVAIDNNTARGSVAIGYQVPQAGEYTLRMSDKPYIMWDKFEALYVTDHEISPEVTTDIMSEPYRFTVANAETNYTRFTVSVILKVEEDDGGGDVGTGVDNTTNNNTPSKFIYQDKMYILRNGVIYDAMGKQVQTINK